MPTGPGDLPAAGDRPHLAPAGRYAVGQVGGAGAAAHHGERMTGVLFESDVVFHADHSCAAGPAGEVGATVHHRSYAPDPTPRGGCNSGRLPGSPSRPRPSGALGTPCKSAC